MSEYEASGQTQAAYCREAGVALATFATWLKQGRSGLLENPVDGWVEMNPPVRTAGAGTVLELEWPQQGLIMRVPVGTPANWLHTVVEGLRCGG